MCLAMPCCFKTDLLLPQTSYLILAMGQFKALGQDQVSMHLLLINHRRFKIITNFNQIYTKGSCLLLYWWFDKRCKLILPVLLIVHVDNKHIIAHCTLLRYSMPEVGGMSRSNSSLTSSITKAGSSKSLSSGEAVILRSTDKTLNFKIKIYVWKEKKIFALHRVANLAAKYFDFVWSDLFFNHLTVTLK